MPSYLQTRTRKVRTEHFGDREGARVTGFSLGDPRRSFRTRPPAFMTRGDLPDFFGISPPRSIFSRLTPRLRSRTGVKNSAPTRAAGRHLAVMGLTCQTIIMWDISGPSWGLKYPT